MKKVMMIVLIILAVLIVIAAACFGGYCYKICTGMTGMKRR